MAFVSVHESRKLPGMLKDHRIRKSRELLSSSFTHFKDANGGDVLVLVNSQKGMQEGHENTVVLINVPGQCRTLSTYLGEGTQYPALQGC